MTRKKNKSLFWLKRRWKLLGRKGVLSTWMLILRSSWRGRIRESSRINRFLKLIWNRISSLIEITVKRCSNHQRVKGFHEPRPAQEKTWIVWTGREINHFHSSAAIKSSNKRRRALVTTSKSKNIETLRRSRWEHRRWNFSRRTGVSTRRDNLTARKSSTSTWIVTETRRATI